MVHFQTLTALEVTMARWALTLLSALLLTSGVPSFAKQGGGGGGGGGGDSEDNTVWLRDTGEDIVGCGQQSHPCRTFNHTFSHAAPDRQLTVIVDTTHKPYEICENITLHVVESVTISTFGEYPLAACDSLLTRFRVIVIISGALNNNLTVKFSQAFVANITIELKSVHVVVESSMFVNSSLFIVNSNKSPFPRDVSILNSEWHGEVTCSWDGSCQVSNDIWITGKFMEITLQNNKIYQTKINLERLLAANILIKDNEVSNNREKPSVAGGIRIRVKPVYNTLFINVVNCSLTRQRSEDPIHATIGLGQAAMYIRPFEGEGLYTFVEVSNCTFAENERGLYVGGFPTKFSVINCLFRSNAAIHPGAAIYINPKDKRANVFVTNSSFEGNSAGRYIPEYYNKKGGQKTFSVDDGEVSMQSPCCKGKIALQGKGGAIRIQGGVVYVNNCNFSDNTALRLGGSIFIDYEGNVSIVNTSFYTSDKIEHVTHGSIIHSNGSLVLDGTVLYARAALDYMAVFQHSGNRWSIRVVDIQVMCPPGYIVRTSNATSYKIEEDVGLYTSIILDQLSYFCVACPRLKYDLTPGYLHYVVSAKSVAYLTLRVDGKAPNLTAGGKLDLIQPKCMPCPFGAVCEVGITPQPSFWGYKQAGAIEFLQCPEGYCCLDEGCTYFDSCGEHRQATLCGECVTGYTESIYGSKCVPKSSCKWFWIFLPVLIPLLYAIITYVLVCNIQTDSATTKADKCVWIDADGTQIAAVLSGSQNGLELSASTSTSTPKDGIGFFPLVLTSVWYIQDMKFFRIDSADNLISHIHDVLGAVSSFRLEEIKLLEDVCVFTNLVAWQKQLLNLAMVPCYFIFYFIVVVLVQIFKSMGVRQKTGHQISVKLHTGIVVVVYLVLQTLLMSTLNLVHCLGLGSKFVLYVSGGVECYQPWQYVMLAYLALCLAPLPLCFFLGPLLAYPAFNSVFKLVIGLCLPGPVFIFLIVKTVRRHCWNNEMRQKPRPERHSTMSAVLYGPYKDTKFPKVGPVSWMGFHLAYRFALVAMSVYLNNHLMRVLCMSITCFVFLLFHSHLRPYRRDTDNNIATGAYSLLMATGVVNCVKATFSSANRKPQGPNAALLQALQHVENSMCIWLPALFVVSVTVYGIYKACSCGDRHQTKRTGNCDNHDMQMNMISKSKASIPDDTE